jgi:hypothetical protein
MVTDVGSEPTGNGRSFKILDAVGTTCTFSLDIVGQVLTFHTGQMQRDVRIQIIGDGQGNGHKARQNPSGLSGALANAIGEADESQLRRAAVNCQSEINGSIFYKSIAWL